MLKLEILKSLGRLYDGVAFPPPLPTVVIRFHISFLALPARYNHHATLADAQNIVQISTICKKARDITCIRMWGRSAPRWGISTFFNIIAYSSP